MTASSESPVPPGAVPSRGAVGWLLALFAACSVWMILAQPLERAVAFSATDDGLYYPRLAENIVSRGVCTYDGITRTNGVHPLWLLLLLPVYAAVSDPFLALRLVYVLLFLLLLGAAALLAGLARRWRMTDAGWAAAGFILLLNLRSFLIWYSLLESALALLVLLFYLRHALRSGPARFLETRAAFVAGLWLGASFLARIDTFLLACGYGAVWLIEARRRPGAGRARLRAAAAAAGGCLLPAAPYLAWNRLAFGHWETVSAWQKSGAVSVTGSWKIFSGWTRGQFIPRVQHFLGWESVPGGLLLGIGSAAAVAAGVYLLTGRRRHRLAQVFGGCAEFPWFVAAHAVFILLAAPREAAASAWYWTPEILLVALSVGAALPEFRWRGVPWVPAGVTLLVAAQIAVHPALTARKTMSWAKLDVAAFLREHMPADARGLMFDSGIVSYFSRRDFAGLNGLIGDFELAALARERRYGELAARYDARWLVLDTPEQRLPAFQPHIRYVTNIRTRFENFREPPKPFVVYAGEPRELEAIWRIRYGRAEIPGVTE